ncbi:hypothetical protein ACWD3I_25240 [Streptomyces sp. NPDC002817]|uniref:hypothetical protein n=1 Tax=Streptomyces sp. NPDC088357 TaxID=3154655 RepID=UPI003430430E
MSTPPTDIPADLAHALRAGIDAARAASAAAAQVSATVLIRAADGRGSIHQAWPGEGPDAWCQVASRDFRAHLLKSGHGDRAQIAFVSLTTDAYERVRDRVLELEECPHDLECECVDEPWPSVDDLRSRPEVLEIVTRDDDERGVARLSSGRIDLTLWDESVRLLFGLIQLTRSVNRP